MYPAIPFEPVAKMLKRNVDEQSGLVDFFDFVWHAVEIFCLNTQTALPLHILPRDRPPQDGKRD